MDSSLTKQQKDAVRKSWDKYQSNGIANGMAFYISWFKTFPDVFPHFKSLFQSLAIRDLNNHPKLKAQAKVFNDALASFVDNLDDGDCLAVLIKKMTENHFKRGIRMKEFQEGFGHFVRFLQDNLHIDAATKESWEKTIVLICQIMKEHMQYLS